MNVKIVKLNLPVFGKTSEIAKKYLQAKILIYKVFSTDPLLN